MKKYVLLVLFLVAAILLPYKALPVTNDYDDKIETVEVPVLSAKLKNGDIISKDDIKMMEFPAPRIRNNIIIKESELVGKTPRRFLRSDKPIRRDEVSEPALVEKNSTVQILYKSKYIELRTIGIAMENGSKGDYIRVKNLKSEALIQALVEAPGIVKVTPIKDHLASIN